MKHFRLTINLYTDLRKVDHKMNVFNLQRYDEKYFLNEAEAYRFVGLNFGSLDVENGICFKDIDKSNWKNVDCPERLEFFLTEIAENRISLS